MSAIIIINTNYFHPQATEVRERSQLNTMMLMEGGSSARWADSFTTLPSGGKAASWQELTAAKSQKRLFFTEMTNCPQKTKKTDNAQLWFHSLRGIKGAFWFYLRSSSWQDGMWSGPMERCVLSGERTETPCVTPVWMPSSQNISIFFVIYIFIYIQCLVKYYITAYRFANLHDVTPVYAKKRKKNNWK